MVERKTLNLVVVGSIPTGGAPFWHGGGCVAIGVGPHRSSPIIRSYHGESTGSHPNSEVKHHWACSVLRWGTTRESQVAYVLPSFFEPSEQLCLIHRASICAIGLVVKYFVANEVPRVRFPDGAFKLSWRSWQRVGLIIPRSPVRPRSKAFLLLLFINASINKNGGSGGIRTHARRTDSNLSRAP